MSDKVTADIKDELNRFMARPETIVYATVLSVDIPKSTIAVSLISGLELDDVRLRSVVKAGNKCVMIPAVDSTVLIGQIENDPEFVMLACEKIDKILYAIGTVKFEVDDAGILLAKGAENMQKILKDLIEGIVAERHLTNNGPTISLTPTSVTTFNNIKTRVLNLFRNA